MNTMNTFYEQPNANNVSKTGKKFKPDRNRPSKIQALLEFLSFLLICTAAPAFLGGVISIFVCFFTLCLGLIGLFAWTRRHALLFTLLSLAVIALCVVNIILRALFVGQCMPYFYYADQFTQAAPGNTEGYYNFGANNNGNNDRDNTYNNSIWCGNRYIVYITHGIIIVLAIPALLCALATLLKRKQRSNVAYQNNNYNNNYNREYIPENKTTTPVVA